MTVELHAGPLSQGAAQLMAREPHASSAEQMLIVARAAQGIAGALLTPASLAIISASFLDETERGKAIGG